MEQAAQKIFAMPQLLIGLIGVAQKFWTFIQLPFVSEGSNPSQVRF
jgi:hypothetical protein